MFIGKIIISKQQHTLKFTEKFLVFSFFMGRSSLIAKLLSLSARKELRCCQPNQLQKFLQEVRSKTKIY